MIYFPILTDCFPWPICNYTWASNIVFEAICASTDDRCTTHHLNWYNGLAFQPVFSKPPDVCSRWADHPVPVGIQIYGSNGTVWHKKKTSAKLNWSKLITQFQWALLKAITTRQGWVYRMAPQSEKFPEINNFVVTVTRSSRFVCVSHC